MKCEVLTSFVCFIENNAVGRRPLWCVVYTIGRNFIFCANSIPIYFKFEKIVFLIKRFLICVIYIWRDTCLSASYLRAVGEITIYFVTALW